MSVVTLCVPDNQGQMKKTATSGYVGEIKYIGYDGVPEHCLACDGSEVSRETYAELFAVYGETYGAGDGETTFNLPDYRGAFFRAKGGNSDELGVEQGDAIRNIIGSAGIVISNSITGAFYGSGSWGYFPQQGSTYLGVVSRFDASRAVPTADENRPVNYAVNVCVVYE